MPSGSDIEELERIKAQMSIVEQQRQQLSDRQAMLQVLEQFKKQCNQAQQTPEPSTQEEVKRSLEIHVIKKQLEILSAKEVRLQKCKDKILYGKSQPGASPDNAPISSQGGVFVLPPVPKPVMVPPPLKPAPKVILDPRELPARPSLMQCPACRQLITTETVFKVGSTTWMVCSMCALLGCVGGCCLIPFCTKFFKDVEHNCPKCRAKIHTVGKL